MDSACQWGGTGAAGCEVRVLVAALHAAQLYCSALAAALICCCTPRPYHACHPRWRGQNLRGVISLALCVTWACGAAVAALRPMSTTWLVGATLAPLAWLGAEALHVALWTRHSAAPLLYLSIYWMLAAASSVAILKQQFYTGNTCSTNVEIYVQVVSVFITLLLSGVDFICFYDELCILSCMMQARFKFRPIQVEPVNRTITTVPQITKRLRSRQKYSTVFLKNVTYKQNFSHFYSKITLFWLNSFLYRGYESPLESDDIGELPNNEKPTKYCERMKRICKDQESKNVNAIGNPNLWRCYMRMVWPNFYIAGVMKLFGDLIGVVPPLGLAAIIQFIEQPVRSYDKSLQVSVDEFIGNGYVMLLIITIALILQALLSQNSTNLVTVEGIRLKTGLQGLLYDKSMRLASWSPPTNDMEEESLLLNSSRKSQNTQSGLLTNLVSQDTYNIMSCMWICHYTWAIPLKVTAILYLLYTKLGISAIIGSATSILIITPLQFYIGKKLSDNSKYISKCTDHRISKMTEILHGMNIIKLYVWEDLFKEKILHLREVELKLLSKDSIYWSILTFTTQLSTIVITVITFIVYYYLENHSLSAMNVFAGLALFNQLSIPLLILPVTVLMIIQAMVSTQRIKEFLTLPESNNIAENNCNSENGTKCKNKFNDAFIEAEPQDESFPENVEARRDVSEECEDHFSDDEILPLTDDRQEYMVRFRNAAFSWGNKSDVLLEVDDLDIPSGKLIMVVGSTGSGKSSLLSAVLGEMYLERGDVDWNGPYSAWYAGQPPWLLEGSVRDNIVMDSPWCPRRYNRVLRTTGLQPDLQLLPDGDGTLLGRSGAPLSGGQRVRVCAARALYSRARLLALDEPLGALDANLARQLVARALLPAARRGLTVMLATNRLELLHYADLVIAMEDGRINGFGRATGSVDGVLARWMELATEARVCATRGTVGPPGGSTRERSRLAQALTRKQFQTCDNDDTMIGIKEAAGSHLLPEVPTRAGGSWRRTTRRPRRRPPLTRQLSSPPPSLYNAKFRREVRRAVSVDASNTVLRREASMLRRVLQMRPQTQNTLTRFTPKTLRRLLTTNSSVKTENNDKEKEERIGINITHNVLTESNTIDENNEVITPKDKVEDISEWRIWWEYGRACRWWGAVFWAAAAGAQALAVTADCWLAHAMSLGATAPLTDQQKWENVRIYGGWSCASAVLAGVAGCAAAGAGDRARRALHDQLLHASLHAPLHHHAAHSLGVALHRFSGDILVLDKKLQTAVSRWAQLALLCTAAVLVCAVAAPWALLALLPAVLIYLTLQSIYLFNARELQRLEASSAGAVVSLCGSTLAGASCVRAGRLQPHMRTALYSRLATNHLATLLLNAANRWLSLTLDLVGAASVVVCVGIAMWSGSSGAGVGLAGAYSLLLPTFLAHLAKSRADLDLQLAALERVITDSRLPREDYRENYPIPADWQRNGKIEFQNITVQESGGPPILHNISLSIGPGEKVAICGRSGSGKSTLLLSCAGATSIVAGRVLVDGQDARRVPLRALRHRLVMLPQDASLFTGTLRENLDPLAVHTDEEIWLSLRAVGLYDFVNAQPAGLECSVSGACRGWSAGRRGRAGSARAALRAHLAAALLLDEPAATIDAPAERALLHNMHKHAPHTTILAVLHRMSSVRGFDRVVVLEEGRIVEQGPTSVLLAQSGSRLARMHAAAHRDI